MGLDRGLMIVLADWDSRSCWRVRWAPLPPSSSGRSEPRSETEAQTGPCPDAFYGCPGVRFSKQDISMRCVRRCVFWRVCHVLACGCGLGCFWLCVRACMLELCLCICVRVSVWECLSVYLHRNRLYLHLGSWARWRFAWTCERIRCDLVLCAGCW